ncbi:hypothetical protein [Methyloprofundus sp.]|uniref:hypothetical protein n=1 Tax=Methyloprofundus sp. TaxID=2020875 RepID=UPI003D1528B9
MLTKKLIALSIVALALPTLVVSAENDADFTDSVLTVPRVVSGGNLFENVRMQLDLNSSTFTLLGAESRSRFSSEMIGMDEVLTDHIANYSWVNGSHGCHINANAAATATGDVVEHCEMLEFAGYTDWRAPTSKEMSEMIIHADQMGVQLNYINPACQFMATSDGFVQTENTSEPGKIVESAVNSGSRCVR